MKMSQYMSRYDVRLASAKQILTLRSIMSCGGGRYNISNSWAIILVLLLFPILRQSLQLKRDILTLHLLGALARVLPLQRTSPIKRSVDCCDTGIHYHQNQRGEERKHKDKMLTKKQKLDIDLFKVRRHPRYSTDRKNSSSALGAGHF